MFIDPLQLKNLSLFLIKLIHMLILLHPEWTDTFVVCYVLRGHSDVAQLLINKGASIDVTDKVS